MTKEQIIGLLILLGLIIIWRWYRSNSVYILWLWKRVGFIYIPTNVYKIGYTDRTVGERIREIKRKANPEYRVRYMVRIPAFRAQKVEAFIHRRLRKRRRQYVFPRRSKYRSREYFEIPELSLLFAILFVTILLTIFWLLQQFDWLGIYHNLLEQF